MIVDWLFQEINFTEEKNTLSVKLNRNVFIFAILKTNKKLQCLLFL